MRLPLVISGLVLAGCVNSVNTANAPGADVPGGGPLKVTRTILFPPAATPHPSPAFINPVCSSTAPCRVVTGVLYDAQGHLVLRRCEIAVAPADHPETKVLTVVGASGHFAVPVPVGIGAMIITVSVEGSFAPRQRRIFSNRDYSAAADPYEAPDPAKPYIVNFGGPATSIDPDAAAYYLPEIGKNGDEIVPPPVLAFDESNVTTVAGDGKAESLLYAGALAIAGQDRFVVVEGGSLNQLEIVDKAGLPQLLAGGPTLGEDYLRDGQGADARFYEPVAITMAPNGDVLVVDRGNSAIRQVTPDGWVTTLAGHRPYGYRDGGSLEAEFQAPQGIAIDSRGNVFVADTGNYCIRKISPDLQVTTFAGAREAGWANGPGPMARFRSPGQIAIAPDDTLYVADALNHRVRRITPDGVVSDAYGALHNSDDGAVELPVLQSGGVSAISSDGGLLVADGPRVYRVDQSGRVTIVAGYGLEGFADGTAQTAYFSRIGGLTVEPGGGILVVDNGNGRIRRIQPAGQPAR